MTPMLHFEADRSPRQLPKPESGGWDDLGASSAGARIALDDDEFGKF